MLSAFERLHAAQKREAQLKSTDSSYRTFTGGCGLRRIHSGFLASARLLCVAFFNQDAVHFGGFPLIRVYLI